MAKYEYEFETVNCDSASGFSLFGGVGLVTDGHREIIARRAGVTGMIAGQTLDVTLEGTAPSLEKVSYIHAHKTADLLTAPLEAGLTLAGASDAALAAGREYGFHLGIAFQMVDDLLDLEGDPAQLGKNTGMDAAQGKLTWPACVGVERTRQDAADHIHKAMEALHVFGDQGNFLKALAQSTLTRVQ